MGTVIDEISKMWSEYILYESTQTNRQRNYDSYMEQSRILNDYLKHGYTKDPKSQKYIEEDGEYEE